MRTIRYLSPALPAFISAADNSAMLTTIGRLIGEPFADFGDALNLTAVKLWNRPVTSLQCDDTQDYRSYRNQN
jgi:hypothetical protein